jgi:glyoxylase-like metal-dependent hydrolase (beta-lactamase superfamily II)
VTGAEGIHSLSIPTPFAVGRVNCFLIEDDPLTLVDTGPNSGQALDELEQALAVHGRRVEDLERIVITHQHIDHEGLLGVLQRRSGAEVAALDRLAPVLAAFGAWSERDDELAQELMLAHGIAREVVIALRSLSRITRAWGASGSVTRELRDGGTLEFAGRVLHVHHRPGHSPTDTVFHDRERGILIGGDHLLGHISSNPLLHLPVGGKSGEPGDGRPHALRRYMESMAETAAMEDVRVVLPGHGDPITDHRRLVADRLRMHERRAAKILRLLDGRAMSAHEVAHELWGKVAVTQAFLALSEALGHLDLLSARGEVVEERRNGVVRFAAAA